MIEVTEINLADDNLVMQADIIGDDEHTIIIPVMAIGSRMVLYDLPTPRAAFDALVREHFVLMSADHENPTTKEEAIAKHNEVKSMKVNGKGIDKLLGSVSETVMEARDARLASSPPEVKAPAPIAGVKGPKTAKRTAAGHPKEAGDGEDSDKA